MRNSSTVPTAAAATDCVTVFVSIELSTSTWVIAMDAQGVASKAAIHRKAAGDLKGLLALIERQRARLARRTSEPVCVVSCYEAGYDGFWLDRALRARGIANHVLDPASILVSRRAWRVKTDRLDAEGLLRVLMAYWRGDRKICSVVRVPSVAQEDAKRPHRERQRLVKERVGHVNRIKGLLATQGVGPVQPLRRDWEEEIAGLRGGDGRPLSPHLLAELRRETRRLRLVQAMIADLEAERDAVLEAEAPASSDEAKIVQLAALRGIAAEGATGLVREVYHRAFDNRRQVGAYVGLTSCPYDSGRMHREQGLSRAGNPRARSLLIQLAWLWLRYQPDSELSKWFRERVGARKGRPRRSAIVALARKLAIALWRYLETGLVPEGAALKGR